MLITLGCALLALGILSLLAAMATGRIQESVEQTEQNALSDAGTVLEENILLALPEATSNVPERLDKKTLINVIAKNQPAVVRILTVYCTDITLVLGASRYEKNDACSAGVGSGSIISSDGYIATNGHVVALNPTQALLGSLKSSEDTRGYLNYLVGTGLITSDKAEAIQLGIEKGRSDALDSIDATSTLINATTITTADEDIYYAVQLSNEPMRINGASERVKVDFTETIVSAKLIDQDFDQTSLEYSLQTGQFTSSDVALLKIDGLYPYVTLGNSDSVKARSQLTAIGFPAFIDGSVNTNQWQTVPSITQGEVTDIATDAMRDGRKIFNTNVPIAQGESGGPAFNDTGEQIGLNTYTHLECEDLRCFGDGTVRDIADLKALLIKNKITLKTGGVTDQWHKGLDAYSKGNYSEALAAFRIVKDDYPANYLASAFARLASKEIGGVYDISTSYQTRSVTTTLIAILAGVVSLIILTTTVLIVHFTRKHRQQTAIDSGPHSPATPL